MCISLLTQAQPFRTQLPRQSQAPQQTLVWMNMHNYYRCSGGRLAGSSRGQSLSQPFPKMSQVQLSLDSLHLLISDNLPVVPNLCGCATGKIKCVYHALFFLLMYS